LQKTGWLPKYRFFVINGKMKPNIIKLCNIVRARWRQAWRPGNTFVVDESVYEFFGSCPCHVFIPRKPHPNGILSYGLSGYTAVLKLPMLLDIEPWVPLNKYSARDSATHLVDRLIAAFPDLQPHIVMDSLFGSFVDIHRYYSKGVTVTMSMTETPYKWLWDLLVWQCPLNAGRAALLPIEESDVHYIASAYHVESESGKINDIRTITSAFAFQEAERAEVVVTAVSSRRTDQNGFFEYETHWVDGDVTWQLAQSFMNDDGTFTYKWLEFAEEEDIRAVLQSCTNDRLGEICEHQSLKVRSSDLL
jgi:hypothetical protein